ncbi:MAG TPA: glycosyltransferase [Acidimicrobiia bacterium]|nr:glycosyltransferase [Acidimicrobiia bacterium]
MHVVFTAVPGHGHVNPMVPLARALAGRGHDVTFVTGVEMRERVEELGFPCVPAGPTLDEMQGNALAEPSVRAFLETEPWRVAAAIFAGRVPEMLDDLTAADVRPDLVVHDAYELSGPILAAREGVPWVTHALGPRWPRYLEEAAGDLVAPAWVSNGCQPVARAGLGHHAYVEICPPVVRPGDAVVSDHVLESRPQALDEPAVVADPFGGATGRRMYATLGTFTNSDAGAFRSVLDACNGIEATVLLTVGSGLEPAALRPLPDNVRVERYVPQAQILGDVDLVLCHGGSGTMLAALAAGVPVVIVPQGADQFRNAPFWVASGAVVTPDGPLSGAVLRRALADARPGGPLREAAERVRDVIAAMPPPETTAAHIESLLR